MAQIPPTGGSPQPIPPQGPNERAQSLAKAAKDFVKQTYDILGSPPLADNPENLQRYTQCILALHEHSQKALG